MGPRQTGLAYCNSLALNTEADSLSRQSHSWESEWQLDTKVFSLIDHTVGPLKIDLFASQLNHWCDKYISWHLDPGAMAFDAFHFDWTNTKFYAFPPFSVIDQLLQRLKKEGGEICLVAPLWHSQPWFNKLLKLSWPPPWLLPRGPHLLRPPQDLSKVHQMWRRLHLTLFTISGDVSETKAFKQMLSPLSCSPGETLQNNNIAHISKDNVIL